MHLPNVPIRQGTPQLVILVHDPAHIFDKFLQLRDLEKVATVVISS